MVVPHWYFQADEAKEALQQRHNYLKFLRSACTLDSDYDAALIIFGELVANVVRHAAGPIQISVVQDARASVTLQVVDSGAPFDIAPSLPSDMTEGGRGLYIVSQLCRNVKVSRHQNGNVVKAQLPLAWGSST